MGRWAAQKDFLGFVIVMSSSDTEQFVITSDRDFQQVLADPDSDAILLSTIFVLFSYIPCRCYCFCSGGTYDADYSITFMGTSNQY